MRPSTAFFSLLGSLPFALAIPQFSVPGGGLSYPVTSALTITWTDDGTAPSIADLTTYQLFLMTGSNAAPFQLGTLPTGSFASGSSVIVPAGTITPGLGGTTTNAYFIKMLATATAGGQVTTYSSRFTLSGMTGSFPATVITGLSSVTGTDGPPAVNQVDAAGTTAAAGAAGFDVPYQLQSGLTKYAPMQPVPPTKITAVNTSPQYPTSSVVLATTFLPIPSIVTTITQANTFAVSSHPNTAAAASQPTDDMQRFLNRWKD